MIRTDKNLEIAIEQGMNALCDTVAKTFGPQGNGILIFDGNGKAYITKDGISVAKHIYSDVQAEDGVIQILREASQKTADSVGDGSTTTLILAKALYEAAKKQQPFNLITTRDLINADIKRINELLSGWSHYISYKDIEAIKQIAMVSANNDNTVGEFVKEAFAKTGEGGTVLMDTEDSPSTYIEYIDGSKYGFGLINKDFVTDIKRQETVYTDCNVVCLRSEVNNINDIKRAVIDSSGTPLVIFATGFSELALQQIILNNNKINARILPLIVTGNTFHRKDVLFDLSVLTGTTVYDIVPKISEGLKMGKCKKIVSSAFTTVLTVEPSENIQIHEENLKEMLKNEKEKSIKEVIQKRLSAFRGKLAVIHVGGATDVEIKERYDRIEDAVCAVKAALDGGIVTGGGYAYYKLSKQLDKNSPLGKALLAPVKTLCNSANVDFDKIAYVFDNNDAYDFKGLTEVFANDMKIIDPTNVIKASIENAASVVIQLLSTGAIVERV